MLCLQFLDRDFSLHDPLPSTFRHIQSLCLKINLEWTTPPPTTFKDGVAECLPQLSALRKLQVSLCISLPITVGSVVMNNTPGKVKAALEATVSPLKAVHNLEIALLDILIQRSRGIWTGPFGGMQKLNEFSRSWAKEIQGAAKAYFDNLQSGTLAAESEFTQMFGERWGLSRRDFTA
jgi:hypothetical protein